MSTNDITRYYTIGNAGWQNQPFDHEIYKPQHKNCPHCNGTGIYQKPEEPKENTPTSITNPISSLQLED